MESSLRRGQWNAGEHWWIAEHDLGEIERERAGAFEMVREQDVRRTARELDLRHARAHGIDSSSLADVAKHPELIAEVQKGVDYANEQVSRHEQVKRFKILPVEWTAESEELTPTLKLRRKVVNQKYSKEIDELYSG